VSLGLLALAIGVQALGWLAAGVGKRQEMGCGQDVWGKW